MLYAASILLLIRESHGNALILALAAVACPAFHWLILAGQTTVIALFIFVLIYLAMTQQLHSITGALVAFSPTGHNS